MLAPFPQAWQENLVASVAGTQSVCKRELEPSGEGRRPSGCGIGAHRLHQVRKKEKERLMWAGRPGNGLAEELEKHVPSRVQARGTAHCKGKPGLKYFRCSLVLCG